MRIDLPSELHTLVRRYGTGFLADAEDFRAMLDDSLDESSATQGEVNLVVDVVRFGSLERLKRLLDQNAEPSAAAAEVAADLAQRRGGDVESAYWACAAVGYAAGLLPRDQIPEAPGESSSMLPPRPPSGAAAESPDDEATNVVSRPVGQGVDDTTTDDTTTGQRPAGSHAGEGPLGTGHRSDREPTRGRRSWAYAGMVAVLVAALIAGGLYLQSTRSTDEAASSTDQTGSGCLEEADFEVPVACVQEVFAELGDVTAHIDPEKPDSCTRKATGNAAYAVECQASHPSHAEDGMYRITLYGGYETSDELNQDNPPYIQDNEAPRLRLSDENDTLLYFLHETKMEDDYSYDLNMIDRTANLQRAHIQPPKDNETLDRDVVEAVSNAITVDGSAFAGLEWEDGNVNWEKELIPWVHEELQVFAEATIPLSDLSECRPVFTRFDSEWGRVECRDGDVNIEFALASDGDVLEQSRRRMSQKAGGIGGGSVEPWTDDAGGTGNLIRYRLRNGTEVLYWDRGRPGEFAPEDAEPDDLRGYSGLLISETGDADALLSYFNNFKNNPRLTPAKVRDS